MSYNKALNAIIAFIEGRPEVTKEILRSPELEVNIPDVIVKLHQAVEDVKREAKVEVLRSVLRDTMKIDLKEPDLAPVHVLSDVEHIIEEYLKENLKRDLV